MGLPTRQCYPKFALEGWGKATFGGPLQSAAKGRQGSTPLRRVDVGDQVCSCTRRRFQNANWSTQLERRQQPRDTIRVRVEDIEPGKTESLIVEPGGGVNIGVPLDEGGSNAIQGNRTVSGNGDEPVERATVHRLDIAQWFGSGISGGANVGSANDPGGQGGRRSMTETIQRKPARPRRCGDRRVRSDDLEEHGIAEAQQKIVRGHAWVLPADLRRNAERLANEGSTCFKREGGDRDVIEKGAPFEAIRTAGGRDR